MPNLIVSRLWHLFVRERKEGAAQGGLERADTHEQVARAALYASHGYFHSGFTPLLFPFVPEVPLE
jgi:hypothetical protein